VDSACEQHLLMTPFDVAFEQRLALRTDSTPLNPSQLTTALVQMPAAKQRIYRFLLL
jgi:hypothetical protein